MKQFEPEDPMELVGVALPGEDPGRFVDEIVQEYLFLGWKPEEIFELFRSPRYGGTHRIYHQMGDAYVKERLLGLAEQWRRGWLRGADNHA